MTDGPVLEHTVIWFTAQMLEKLERKKNLAKGAWWEMLPDELLTRLQDEVKELDTQVALGNVGISTADEIISECCDVANFAMFIADVTRRHAERLAGTDQAEG